MIFRYPGGKGKLMSQFLEDIPTTGDSFAEPFVGGGSVALAIANRDPKKQIYLNDFDPWVASFWSIVTGTDEIIFNALLDNVKNKPTIEQFKERREKFVPQDFEQRAKSNLLDGAFNALFFNRTTFSGMFGSGPIGAYEQRGDYLVGCRFQPSRLIKEIRAAHEVMKGRTQVFCLDFELFLASLPANCFLYLDPPYIEQGEALYGATMGINGHDRLRKVLGEHDGGWLLSYDSKPQKIRDLYAGFKMRELSKFRSMGSKKDSEGEIIRPDGISELLIYSKEESVKTCPNCNKECRQTRKHTTGACTTLASVPFAAPAITTVPAIIERILSIRHLSIEQKSLIFSTEACPITSEQCRELVK